MKANNSIALLIFGDISKKLSLHCDAYICQHPENGAIYLSNEPLNAIAFFNSSRSEVVPTGKELKFRPGRLHDDPLIKLNTKQEVRAGGTTVKRIPELKEMSGSHRRPSTAPAGSMDYCRVCYGPSLDGNPLLNICKCAGDTKFQHFECLVTWVRSQIQVRPRAFLLPKRAYICEICHESYLSHLIMRRVLTRIAGYDNWDILECWQGLQRPDKFLVQLSSEGVLIGRSESADIVLSDKTVSRNHARLSCEGNKVVLKDLNSSCGTWIVTSEAIPLLKYRSVVLLASGHTFEVRLHKAC